MGWKIRTGIIKLPKLVCFWLQAISFVVHLFDAVSTCGGVFSVLMTVMLMVSNLRSFIEMKTCHKFVSI